MAKKFDKISPKNISEEKFNQLVDALPSSVIEQPKAIVTEKKEKIDNVKVKKSKSFKSDDEGINQRIWMLPNKGKEFLNILDNQIGRNRSNFTFSLRANGENMGVSISLDTNSNE